MKLEPGQYAPRTATYDVVDASGKICGSVSVEKGQKMPPTHDASHHYELKD